MTELQTPVLLIVSIKIKIRSPSGFGLVTRSRTHMSKAMGASIGGFNDLLSSYGGNPGYITDHNNHGLALNVLTRISQLISNNIYGMDTNLSHWTMQCGVVGQATWGNVYVETRFDKFVPVYSLK